MATFSLGPVSSTGTLGTKPAVPKVPGAAPAVPSAAPINWGALSMSAPAAPKPAVPSLPTGGMGSPALVPGQFSSAPAIKPAVPNTGATPTPTPAVPAPAASTPAVPNVPPTPAPLSQGYVKTPSGAIVDPNTGALVTPSGSTAMVGNQPSNFQPPTTPNTGSAPNIFNTDVSQNPLTTSQPYNNAIQAVKSASTMSPEESAAMEQLMGLQTSAAKANADVQGQPIAMPFITGQQAQIQREEAVGEQPLQNKLALLQAQRQIAMQGATTELGAASGQLSTLGGVLGPKTLPYGGQEITGSGGVINGGIFGGSSAGATFAPTTGLQPGASSQDILGYLSANGVDASRYDMPGLINAVQKGSTAQDIIAGRANVAGAKSAASTGSGYAFNPATGTFQQRSPGTAGTSFGSGTAAPAGSAGGYQPGMLNSLLKSQGAPTDEASLAALYKQIGGQGTYANDAAHNSQIFSAMGGQIPTPAKAAAPTTIAGKAATSGIGSLDSTNKIDAAALAYIQSGDISASTKGLYPNDVTAVRARAQSVLPGFNPAIAQGNADAISKQIIQRADVTRAITAADSNFGLLTDTFKGSKVNDMESPILNNLKNAALKGYVGDSDVINFQSGVSTLQTEYAQILGRGGEVTDSVRKSAQNVINGDYSMKDLKSLHEYIDKESANVVGSYDKTISGLASGSSSNSGSSDTASGTKGTTPSGISYTIN